MKNANDPGMEPDATDEAVYVLVRLALICFAIAAGAIVWKLACQFLEAM